MSQSIITLAFETYKAQQEAIAAPIELNEFVLALVPNQDPTLPIDRNEGLPPQNQIVHVANVTQTGFVNPNAVVYSLIMDTRIGDFEFNWVGLRNKQSGVLASILHIPTISKFKSVPGVQNGNSVTRSILMAYEGAKNTTGITVDASTWQIDFTARLFGMDEAERLANLDVFGQAAFLADGFKVKKSGSNYLANVGRGYVGGLRCHLDNDATISGVSNSSAIYLDASSQGQLTSQWQTVFEIKVSKSALSDYVDADGYQHYVTKIADINSAGNVIDTRHVEGFSEHLRHDEQATKAQAEAMTSSINWLSPLRWKEAFLSRLSNSFSGTRTDYAASEKALSDGLNTKLGKTDKAADSNLLDGLNSTTVMMCSSSRGVNINVGGDANTYYPVLIPDIENYAFNNYSISRKYNWTAPIDWSESNVRKGGLTLTWQSSGSSGWGGNDKTIRVTQFAEIYSTMVAGMTLTTSGLIVFLRGGGAKYQVNTEAGRSARADIHLSGYTASDGRVYPPRTNTDSNATEIFPLMPARNAADIYDGGMRVYSPNNPIPEALRIPVDVLDSRVVGVLRRNNTSADLLVCVGGSTNGPISYGRVDGIPVGLFGPHSGVTGRTSISFIVKPNSEYIIDSNVFVELWTEYQVV